MAKDHGSHVHNHVNDPTIHVSLVHPLQSATRTPSCVHAFAQIQIHNLHKSESLIVQDVQVLSSQSYGLEHMKSTIFGGRQTVIYPATSSLLPVSIFAAQMNRGRRTEWDAIHHFTEEGVGVSSSSSSQDISFGMAMDFADMLILNPRDLGGYNVEIMNNSTVILKTNRGKYQTTLSSSHILLNPYGLPHTITFYVDGFVSDKDFIAAKAHHKTYRGSMTQVERDKVAYEYDIYMDNPFEESMSLLQAYSSRPDLINVLYEHPSGENQMDGKNSRFNNCGIYSNEREHCNLAQSSLITGPICVKNDTKRTYVATLRLKEDALIDLRRDRQTFLGYFHLKFHNSFFSIALEYETVLPTSVVTKDVNGLNNSSPFYETKNIILNMKSKPNPDADRIFHENLSGGLCDEKIISSDTLMERLDVAHLPRFTSWNISFPPPQIDDISSITDLGTITPSVEGKSMIDISITNRSDKRIVIRRIFAHSYLSGPASTSRDRNFFQSIDSLSSHINVTAKHESSEQTVQIDPGESRENCLKLIVEVSSKNDSNVQTSSIQGSVIFHIDQSMTETYKNNSTVSSFNVRKDSIIEIPWKLQIAKGYLEYDFRATIFALNPRQQHHEDECGYIERSIIVKNMFNEELRFKRVYVKDEKDGDNHSKSSTFCISHFSVVRFNDVHSLAPMETMAAITIRFALKNFGSNGNSFVQSQKCHLIIETSSGTEFEMALTVDNESLKAVVPQRITPKECLDIDILNCFDTVLSRLNDNESSLTAPAIQFLNSINTKVSMNPLLLDFGVLSPKAVETESIYLENYNSVPLNITITFPTYEGTVVRVGRTPFSFEYFVKNSYIKSSSILKTISDETGIHASKQILDFFHDFKYRDDVKLAPAASRSLGRLFHSCANVKVHRTNNDYLMENEFEDSHNHGSLINSEDCCKMLIMTKYYSFLRELVLQNDESKQYQYTLPPGSITRLEVSVLPPPKDLISRTSNLVNIITAGVVIETAAGQSMPIIVKYTMFSGNITISAPTLSTDMDDPKKNVLNVPLSHDRGTELFIHTEVNSGIEIVSIESCNSWFTIYTPNDASFQNLQMAKFVVQSIVDYTSEMHFFDYALLWLQKHQTIRDNRCVFDYEDDEPEFSDLEKTTMIKTRTETVLLIEKALISMKNLSVIESFFVPKEDYVIVEQAIAAFEKIKPFNLHVIEGGMQVHMILANETESFDDVHLSKPLKDIILRTNLELPRFVPNAELNGGELRFPVTELTQISKIMIPIQNPTAKFVRVRLMVHDPEEVYISSNMSTQKTSSWWEGGGIHYLYDDRGYKSFHEANPSSCHDATNAFSVGCTGRRCSYMPNQSNSGTNEFQMHQLRRSSIGASSAKDSELRGRIYSSHGILDSTFESSDKKSKAEPFSVQSISLAELILPPHANTAIGPIYFRPDSRQHFSSVLSVQNNITGLESFKVRGLGATVKLVFLDRDDSDEIEVRFGKTYLPFEGSNTSGQPQQIKSVYLANLGDLDVKILDMWLSPQTAKLEALKPHSDFGYESNAKCQTYNFYLIGCDSSPKSYDLPTNQQKPIHISWVQDCSFDSIYLSLIVEYQSISTSPTIGTVELMVGYEMTPDDKRTCMPSSLKAVKKKFHSSKRWWFFTVPTFAIPLFVFILLTIDMVDCARQSYFSSHKFQTSMRMKTFKSGSSKKTGFKNWSSAYRCLSRADPSSQELIQLSKEQTRQMLLNTFKREDMISPQCILANGTLSRQRYGTGVVSSSGSHMKKATSPRFGAHVSLSDAIFPKRRYILPLKGDIPVVPCGLDWRMYSNVKNAMIRPDDVDQALRKKDTIHVQDLHSSSLRKKSTPPQAQLENAISAPDIDKGSENNMKNHRSSSFEEVDWQKSSIHMKRKNKATESVLFQSKVTASNDEDKRVTFLRDQTFSEPKKIIKRLKDVVTEPTSDSSPTVKRSTIIKTMTSDQRETSPMMTFQSAAEERSVKTETSFIDGKKAPSVTLKDFVGAYSNQIQLTTMSMEPSLRIDDVDLEMKSKQEYEELLIDIEDAIHIIPPDSDDSILLESAELSPEHANKTTLYSSLSLARDSECWSPTRSNTSLSAINHELVRDHPVGLAPPPGFDNILNALQHDTSSQSVASGQDIKKVVASEPGHSLNDTIYYQEESVVNSFNINIDIMNLFDFLDESGDMNTSHNLDLDIPDHVPEETIFTPLMLGTGQNPWGESHITSNDGNNRFKFDDDSMGLENHSSTRVFSSSFFLEQNYEDTDDVPAKPFDADAFFAGIFDADEDD